jgi:hypothetical protein
MKAFWRGNGVTCFKYFPQQFMEIIFKDRIKQLFPIYDVRQNFLAFFGTNIMSSFLGAGSVSIVMYPFNYLRVRLASDVCGE